jgi:hypothetical protein
MRGRPVRHITRRSTPLKPRDFHDSTVVVMDAEGHVLRRVPAAEFAAGCRGKRRVGRRPGPLPTITPETVATWDAGKRMHVRKRLKQLGQAIPECLTPQFSKRWHRAAG